jgi:2'-5' RNA ligase
VLKVVEYTRVNIAIRPPQGIEDRLIGLSRKISRQARAYFVLDGVNFHPHATLYSPEYPTKNLGRVLELTGRIARSFPKFQVGFNGVQSHWGFIDVEVGSSEEIKRLHELVVQKLDPLREGHIRNKYKRKEELRKFSKEQRKNIRIYGYPDAMGLFRPHFTITRLTDEDKAKELARRLSWPIKKTVIDKVLAFRMGQHGTCREIIREFSLTDG